MCTIQGPHYMVYKMHMSGLQKLRHQPGLERDGSQKEPRGREGPGPCNLRPQCPHVQHTLLLLHNSNVQLSNLQVANSALVAFRIVRIRPIPLVSGPGLSPQTFSPLNTARPRTKA